MAKPKTESLRHQEAFEYYYRLGDSRSTPPVAAKYSVSDSAVKQWAAVFGWTNRVKDRDRELGQRLAEASKTDLVKMRERHLKVVKAAQGQFVNRLAHGDARVGARDFLAIAQYEAKLMGFDPDGGGASAEDVAELLRVVLYVLQTKIPDACPNCRSASSTKAEVSAELLRITQQIAQDGSESPTIDPHGPTTP